MADQTFRPDEIFDQVVDLPAEKRTARLDEICGDDAELRREVESLLAADDECGDFMAEPLDLGTVDPADDPAPRAGVAGQRLGSWRLVEPLGSGGMGEVWLATREVEGAEQKVALKIIRTAILAPDGLMRFRNECRVLARLEHPGIARLIEGAVTPEGVPYLVVEYVEGRPLDVWCEENDLGVRARIELLARVCEAVRHLNRHSVIHRDIKPANILVGRDGRPRLIDFGIARVLDAAEDDLELTVTGMERMTPVYASPEQLRGDPLSIASDVYSLGVVGYRLLTGQLPHAGRRRWELEKEITTGGPPRPSDARLAVPWPVQRLRGDLDTIIQKALHPDAARRYPSAEALREDLDRYLEGRPVLARGDSFAYVAGKFVRRHAFAATSAAIALLLLVAAVVSGFTLYGRAEAARREALQQQRTAVQVSDFLESLLAAVNPATSGAHRDVTVREALDAASLRVDRELRDQPAVAASLHATIGSAYLNLGVLEEAGAHLGAADRLYDLVGDEEGRARVAVRRGELASDEGDYESAESILIGVRDTADPVTRAYAHLHLSNVYADQSRLDESYAEAGVARALAEEYGGRDPLLPVQTLSQLGILQYRRGSYAAAESVMAEAVETARADLGPAHVLTGEVTQNLGVILTALGRTAEAIEAFSAAFSVYGKVYPPDHPEFATTLLNRGDARTALGRYDEAAGDYERALEIFDRDPDANAIVLSLATNGLAHCRWRQGDLAAADSLFVAAEEAMAGQMGESHPWTALTRNNLAHIRFETGRRDEARRMATGILADLEIAFPDGHEYLARPLELLADIDLAEGRLREARTRIDRADTLTFDMPPTGANRAGVGILRAKLHRAEGRPEAADAVLDSLLFLAEGSGEAGIPLRKRIAALRP